MEGGLSEIAEGIKGCRGCPLWKSRKKAVPGEGPSRARLMLIGEAPGEKEDEQGIPFVGRSGVFLNELLSSNHIDRKQVFITGSVKCRPPKNRNPTSAELAACRRLWLNKQIDAIKPDLIVVLGKVALKNLLGGNKVGDLRGRVIERGARRYFVTYHPASGMRFPKIREAMKEDFRKIQGCL
ncbi:MAG: uracil-DNA glycosylase [Thermoplasmata archaeon]|nr:MAG: uracil-DNA glycosylase [Thermoplasmata archaeon]